MRRLSAIIFVAVILDNCITAVTTLVTKSLEPGLATGSYTSGPEALLLALFTLLSFILSQERWESPQIHRGLASHTEGSNECYDVTGISYFHVDGFSKAFERAHYTGLII